MAKVLGLAFFKGTKLVRWGNPSDTAAKMRVAANNANARNLGEPIRVCRVESDAEKHESGFGYVYSNHRIVKELS